MILAVCANPSVDSFWSLPAVRQGTTNRSSAETYYPGGKGIHIAFALQELGEEVTVLGIWGGQTGEWLKKQCNENDINTIGPSVEEWNRLCISMKSNTDWNETELLGAGPKVDEATRKAFYEAYRTFINKYAPQAVVMSGSAPAGFENRIYRRLVSVAQNMELPTFVDASNSLLKEALEVQPHAIHINHHEGQEICNYDHPGDIARWLGDFCNVAAVTAGTDGLYLQVDKQLFNAYHRMDSSKIVSTVGAGDCLFAGLCKATLKNKDSAYWAKYSAACGTANCINPQLGILKNEDVEKIMKTVTLKNLNI